MGYLQSGLFDQAVEAFEASLAIRRMLNQEGTHEYALTLHNLGIAKGKLGLEDAAPLLRESLKSMQSLNLGETIVYANALANEARHLVSIKQYREAIANYERSLNLLTTLGEAGKPSYWETQRAFAGALVFVDPARALQLCQQIDSSATADSIFSGRVRVCWAMAERAIGNKQKALERLEEAINFFNRHDPNEATWLTRKKAAPFLAEAERLMAEYKSSDAAGMEEVFSPPPADEPPVQKVVNTTPIPTT